MLNLRMFTQSERVVCNKSSAYDSLMPHSHDFYELSCIISGSGMHYLGDKHYRVKKNDIYFIVDDAVHSISPIEGAEGLQIINIIFQKSFIESVGYDFESDICLTMDDYVVDLFKRAYLEFEHKENGYDTVIYHIVLLILDYIVRFSGGNQSTERTKTIKKLLKNSEIIDCAKAYIIQHYSEDISVADIAKEIGIGISVLQKVFKKEKDTTVKKTLICYRIKIACGLLISSNLSVQKIAEQVGFNDLKNFYYTFKQITKITPGKYREQNGFEEENKLFSDL